MKTYFTTPITSKTEAKKFFKGLVLDDKLFHCDDNPATVMDSRSGNNLFLLEEIFMLHLRMQEVRTYCIDPCKTAMKVADKYTVVSREQYEQLMREMSAHFASIIDYKGVPAAAGLKEYLHEVRKDKAHLFHSQAKTLRRHEKAQKAAQPTKTGKVSSVSHPVKITMAFSDPTVASNFLQAVGTLTALVDVQVDLSI